MSTTESLTLTSSSVRLNEDDVIIDSGASNHAFNNRKWFTSLKTLDQPYRTATFSGGHAQAQEVGEVKLEFVCSDGSTTIGTLTAYYTPTGPVNVISPGRLRHEGIIVDGFTDTLRLKQSNREIAHFVWNDVADVPVFEIRNKPAQTTQSTTSTIPSPARQSPTRQCISG